MSEDRIVQMSSRAETMSRLTDQLNDRKFIGNYFDDWFIVSENLWFFLVLNDNKLYLFVLDCWSDTGMGQYETVMS